MKTKILLALEKIGICHIYLASVHAINVSTQEKRTFRYTVISINEAGAKRLAFLQYEKDWGRDFIIELDPYEQILAPYVGLTILS